LATIFSIVLWSKRCEPKGGATRALRRGSETEGLAARKGGSEVAC
jgi:hypothetical protein